MQTSGSARRSGAKRVQLDGVANRSPSRFPVGAAPPLLPALNPYRPPIERQLRPPACHKVQLASTSTPPGPPSWQPSRNRPATATIPEAIVSRRVDTRDRIAASSLSDRLDRDSRSDQGVTPAGQQFAHVSIGRDEQPTGQARSTQSPGNVKNHRSDVETQVPRSVRHRTRSRRRDRSRYGSAATHSLPRRPSRGLWRDRPHRSLPT